MMVKVYHQQQQRQQQQQKQQQQQQRQKRQQQQRQKRHQKDLMTPSNWRLNWPSLEASYRAQKQSDDSPS